MIVMGGYIIALKYVIIDFVWGFACLRDVMQALLLGVRLESGTGTVVWEPSFGRMLGRLMESPSISPKQEEAFKFKKR